MKKFTFFKSVMAFVFMSSAFLTTSAQNNIAPQATVTASTCYTGPCSTLNDLNLGTCGSQSMWISTSSPPSTSPGVNWIEWNFPSAVSVDQFVIHHANGPVTSGRNLAGFLIQTWNGSSWVNHQTISGLPRACINTVPFNPIQGSTRFRITSFTMFPQGQLSNPNFREIEVIEAILVNDNAATLAIDSPTTFCEGYANIKATIGNRGLNQINSVIVNWTFGGAPRTPIAFTGLLDTAGGTAGPRDTTLYLGNELFGAGVPEEVVVWTSLPNGNADQNTGDDTLSEDKQPSLAGNFTIDPLGTGLNNYVSFADAVNDLTTFGVCGPVTFAVAPGTFTEQLTFGEIKGGSATNTITFTADTAGVIVEYGATSSGDNWVLKMNKTQWVTLDGFTFQNAATGSFSYRALVDFNGGSSNNTFMNNVFNGYQTTSSSSNYRGWTTSSAGNNDNKFMNNEFNYGGYYGFYFRGGSTSATNMRNEFDGNTFDGGYLYATYFYYGTEMKFNNNKIVNNTTRTTSGYGLYMYYQYGHTEVIGNDIDFIYNGIRCYYWYGDEDDYSIVANNMVHAGLGSYTTYGVYFYAVEYADIVHNTVWANAGPSNACYGLYMSQGSKNNILNNSIFAPQGSSSYYGLYVFTAGGAKELDYNNVWAPTMNHGYYNGVQSDLTAWKAAGAGANGYDADPGYFKKDSMYSCHDSLDNRGIGVESVMYDFQGDNRDPVTPDIGADEFIGGDSSTYSAGPDGLLCNGAFIEIGANITGADYIWNTSETTGTIMVNTVGDYTVSVTSACGGSFLDVVTVTDNTPNAVYSYTNSFYTGVFKNTSRVNGDMWRWVFYDDPAAKNNPMDTVWTSNQKDQVYFFGDNGPYYVCLTTINECDTVEICNVWTGTVGIDENNLNDVISLIPNPVSTDLTIQFNNFNDDQINVEMTNVQGQVVYSNQFVDVSPRDNKVIDVSSLNKGMYIVKFTTENEVIAKQIIVQ